MAKTQERTGADAKGAEGRAITDEDRNGARMEGEELHKGALAKEYLERPYLFRRQIEMKTEERKYYQEISSFISSCGFEEHYNASRKEEPPFISYVEKGRALEEEIARDRLTLGNMIRELEEMIDQLPDVNERLVLRYRYLLMMSWGDVINEFRLSRRWVFKTHRSALKHFEERWRMEISSMD